MTHEHPCSRCKYFYGWHEIKVDLKGMVCEEICVDIPICDRVVHVIALYKCDYFKLKKDKI